LVVRCHIALILLALLSTACRETPRQEAAPAAASPASSPPAAPASSPAPARRAAAPIHTGIEMRNVALHVAEGVVLDVRTLDGEFVSHAAGEPPVFDGPASYTLRMRAADLAMDAVSLTNMMATTCIQPEAAASPRAREPSASADIAGYRRSPPLLPSLRLSPLFGKPSCGVSDPSRLRPRVRPDGFLTDSFSVEPFASSIDILNNPLPLQGVEKQGLNGRLLQPTPAPAAASYSAGPRSKQEIPPSSTADRHRPVRALVRPHSGPRGRPPVIDRIARGG
jgi:hypothetical protein